MLLGRRLPVMALLLVIHLLLELVINNRSSCVDSSLYIKPPSTPTSLIHSITQTQTADMAHCSILLPLLLLIATSLATAASSCTPSDVAALQTFKSSLTDPYLGIFNTWTGTDCSSYFGVGFDPSTGHIIEINLRGESEDPIFTKSGRTSGYMTGTISPAICQLDQLTTIVIADWNGLFGEIPDCITSLSNLRILDLVGNNLTGNIPPQIGNLKQLAVLNLADNSLVGEIPDSITDLESLKHLDLRNNQLSGKIPVDFGKLKMLSRALLSRNQLEGSIPESVSKMYRLADLDLSTNKISGSVPESIGDMNVLSTLNLDGNMIGGEIPGKLLGSKGLGILNLSRNALEGNIPDTFGPNGYFMVLDLSYNNLKGPILKSLSSASFVGHLDLSHNRLCGAIPAGEPFDRLGATSFGFNDCLCGNPLMTC